MKKLILVFTILLSFGIANAQWYQTKYGVTNINELTKEQCDLALKKTNKTIKAGKVLTFGGAAVIFFGGNIYLNDRYDSFSFYDGRRMMAVGAVACGVGIPVWIIGESQKSQIEIALIKFEDTSFVPSFGLKFTF